VAEPARDLRFDVRVDDELLVEDLARASDAAKAAIEAAAQKLREDGVPVDSLRPCEDDARDGTDLGGCVKHYIPQPDGRWGAVFTIDKEASKPALLLLAAGERHPDKPWRPSVYQIAHRRLHRDVSPSADGV
jgi:hypothetical protein